MNDDLNISPEQQNMKRLVSTNLLENWLDNHPDGWDHSAWEGLLSEVNEAGFMPIQVNELGEWLEQTRLARIKNDPRTARRSASSVPEIQTVEKYGTAQWAESIDFADRRAYEPGDFWIGRCPVTGRALGYRDQTHIWVNAGTRGGKGSTLVVPNHLLWKGSLVSIDPKGENATVTAARRGDGNDVCDGMGQFVTVLDPMGCSSVDPKYRRTFNPLDTLTDDDPKLIEKASAMAEAIVIRPENEHDSFWNDTTKDLIEALILHVVTFEGFEGRRTMKTVYELATRGDVEHAKLFNELNRQEDEKAGRIPDPNEKPIGPIDAMLRIMKSNEACGGVIAGIAEELLELRTNKVNNQWGGIRSAIARHMAFMKSPQIQECMEPSSEFRLSDLRDRPEGMSLYLCLQLDDMKTYNRWLRLMITTICYELRKSLTPMASGHELLMCLDEFATLGHLEQIKDGFSTLAGYGVKMLVVTQFIQQLQEHYKESWHTFLANTGLRMFFAFDEESGKKISEWIGDTEVVVGAETISLNASEQDSAGITMNEGQAESESHGGNESESHGQSHAHGTQISKTDGESYAEAEGRQQSRALGNSSNMTQSDGGSSGQGGNRGTSTTRNEGNTEGWDAQWGMNWLQKRFALFRDEDRRGLSSGSSHGQNSGVSWNDARSWQKSMSAGKSDTVTDGTQHTLTRTKNHSNTQSTSDTETNSLTRARGTNWNTQASKNRGIGVNRNKSRTSGTTLGFNQTVHKRPLLPAHDLVREFAWLEEADPYFPGLALVMIPNENPIIAHKTLYYDDKGFDGLYDRHPAYPHTNPQPLIRTGTVVMELPDPFWYECDEKLIHWPTISMWFKKPGEKITKGEPLCSITPGLCHAHGYDASLTFHAPFSGTMKHILLPANGEIMHGENLTAEVEFFLPTVWEEADQEILNAELERFADGSHVILDRHRRIMDERKQLALVQAPVPIEFPEPVQIEQVVADPLVTEASENTIDLARELHKMDESEFKSYRMVAIPVVIAGLWLVFAALLHGLKPSAVEYWPPVQESDRPHHYEYSLDRYHDEFTTEYEERKERWGTERWRFDTSVKEWGGLQSDAVVAKYYSQKKWRSRIPMILLFSFLVTFGATIGLMGLWSMFLDAAWNRRTEPSSSNDVALHDAKRSRWFYQEDLVFLVIVPLVLAGAIYGVLTEQGFARIGVAFGFAVFGLLVGWAIGFVTMIVRRVIWAVNEGELVDGDCNVVPFNPKLSNH